MLRLLPPAASAELPAPDDSAGKVLAHVADATAGHLLVVGGPGSGKTSLAVHIAVDAVVARGIAPERVLVIAPTRVAAASLRDRATLALNRATGTPVVRTAAAAGFAILAAAARSVGDPGPVLISGAEQDVELRSLLAGHRRGEGAAVDWSAVVPAEATALPGFREELRNLMMRAAEFGLDPDDLRDLGERTDQPAWVAAAAAYREYLDVTYWKSTPADQGDRYDPASVVATATDRLQRWSELADGTPPSWDLVIVDDYQDATAATTALLHAMAQHGARLVLIGNADQTVQGFRGAMPSALAAATHARDRGGLGAARIELTARYRQHGVLARVTDAVVERVGVMGEGSATRRPRGADSVEPGASDSAQVAVVVAAHRYAQSRAIATLLRRARHGLDGEPVPWGQMAVIAHSTSTLREIRSDLLAADIPCETLGDALALHSEPAVAPLLTMLRVALGEPWTEHSALEVLGSRLVGLDPVALRRLRRHLVREERQAGGQRSSGELLVEAMAAPANWSSLGGPDAERAAAASRAVEAGAKEAAARVARGGTAEPAALLWTMWDTLGVARAWRDAAIAGSARDDADLDAVIALMRAAQTFTERLAHAHPSQFVEYVQGQDFAADSLGARAQARDVVTFATPASAAGREWDVVAIAGLEEGAWPNLRLRDTVLGAHHLADVLAGRAAAEPLSDSGRVEAAHAARRAVLDDETRALAVAVSRARRSLMVTCVDGEDSQPSRYLAWIEAAAGVSRVPAHDVRGVSDLREAVVRLRVDGARAAGAAREQYAAMLAHLARAHAAGADPRDWHGVPELSTHQPFWDADQQVRVSPSKIDTVETCALKWALETAGGTAESSDKQLLGSLIHEIAAQHPRGTEAELRAALDSRWHEISGGDTWPQRVQRAKADEMIRRLAMYIASSQATVVQVEQAFRVELDRAVLSGSADRVETTGGSAVIVDLKTGAAIPAADAANHGQLSMYQLAANEGAFPGVEHAAGAQLVFVGGGTVKPSIRDQGAIDTGEQRERLGAVVDLMTGTSFLATPNDMCDHCPVQRSCPARPTGKQVSDS